MKILLISWLLLISQTCIADPIVVKIETEYEGFKEIHTATCPICNKVNRVDFNNRFAGKQCEHFVNTRKFMVFEKTENEKLKDKIRILQEEIESLKDSLIKVKE